MVTACNISAKLGVYGVKKQKYEGTTLWKKLWKLWITLCTRTL